MNPSGSSVASFTHLRRWPSWTDLDQEILKARREFQLEVKTNQLENCPSHSTSCRFTLDRGRGSKFQMVSAQAFACQLQQLFRTRSGHQLWLILFFSRWWGLWVHARNPFLFWGYGDFFSQFGSVANPRNKHGLWASMSNNWVNSHLGLDLIKNRILFPSYHNGG